MGSSAASNGTPIFLTSLLKAAEQIGADLSSLKQFSLGASAVTPETVKLTDKLGMPGGRVYGSTEHPVISGGGDNSLQHRAYTDGQVGLRNEVRILDDDGNDLPIGQAGA